MELVHVLCVLIIYNFVQFSLSDTFLSIKRSVDDSERLIAEKTRVSRFAAVPQSLEVRAVALNDDQDDKYYQQIYQTNFSRKLGLNVTWQSGEIFTNSADGQGVYSHFCLTDFTLCAAHVYIQHVCSRTMEIEPECNKLENLCLSGTATESYSLLIAPVNKTKEAAEYCGTLSYHRDLDPQINSWLVSYDFRDEDSRLKVELECGYLIKLWANPSDGKHVASTTYVVPVCVNGTRLICSCRRSSATLPHAGIQAINYTDTKKSLLVKWAIDGEITNMDLTGAYFMVLLGYKQPWMLPNNIFQNSLKSVDRVPWQKNKLNYTYEITNLDGNKTNLIISIRVLDRFGCIGPSSNKNFTAAYPYKLDPLTSMLEERNVSSKFHATIINNYIVFGGVIPVITLLVLIIVTIALGHKKYKCLSRQPVHLRGVKSWRCVYRGVSREASNPYAANHTSAEECNILYVEQEIQEAIDRGDVDNYEVNYNRLHIGKQIGRGAFGRVFLARIDSVGGRPISQIIAVKKLKQRASPDELDDFLAEIAMLKRVGYHRNVVSLVGCCTLSQPYCMLMEWVPCGDLLRYLRKLRIQLEHFVRQRAYIATQLAANNSDNCNSKYLAVLPDSAPDSEGCSYVIPDEDSVCFPNNQPLSSNTLSHTLPPTRHSSESYSSRDTSTCGSELDARELHNFALQIAEGMAHLERKQIIHRDLAARNVLINENRILKISDFGLSRTGIYVNTRRRKVPLRWLSIEAIRDQVYSTQSDVWAFGVVLWEIGTLGAFPYANLADADLLPYLVKNKRLEKPINCTDDLYELMSQCWKHEAEMRPSFVEICDLLKTRLGPKPIYVNFSTIESSNGSLLPPVSQDDSD